MDAVGTVIIILVFIAVFFPIFRFVKKSFDLHNAARSKMRDLNCKFYDMSIKHISGLPLAEGTYVEAYYNDDKLVFCKDTQEITIATSKIVDMDTAMGKDVKQQAATGAIAGYVIGGGLAGAAIGSLLTSTLCFVIVYKNEDEDACRTIIFDAGVSGFAREVINDFKANRAETSTKIEL